MELNFGSKLGYRPSGDLLKYWAMIPQVTTNINNETIPSLFGNIKSSIVAYIMVALLIVVEAILIFQLNEEGVGVLAIFAISLFDFIIAIIPPIILLQLDLIPSQIKTNIFINREKRKNPKSRIPERFEDNREHFNQSLDREMKRWKGEKWKVFGINVFFILLIIGLNVWKFFIYYEVLGNGIFVEPIGRFILTVILLSIIIHILFTKICFLNWRFKSILKSQLKAFDSGEYRISAHEKNAFKEIEFDHTFLPAHSDEQRIAQKILPTDENYSQKENILEFEHDGILNKYRVNEFVGKENVHFIYSGLVLDADIQGLYANQKDTSIRKAVIVSCKETQLSQLING